MRQSEGHYVNFRSKYQPFPSVASAVVGDRYGAVQRVTHTYLQEILGGV